MKQGRASRDVMESGKREPRPRAVIPSGVAQYGKAMGDHVTGQGATGYRGTNPFGGGRGYKAPGIKNDSKNGGSQGRY